MKLQLTETERNIIIAVANGHKNKTIARDHRINESTASRHVRKLCVRLGARDRGHLVGIAFAERLIRPSDVARPAASTT